MSNSYNITKVVNFTEITTDNFYWTLTATINSGTNISTKPFLIEAFVPANTAVTDSSIEERFIRSLLNTEIGGYPPKADIQTSGLARWVTYRSNTFTNKFYTYKALEAAINSLDAILKANIGSYSPEDIQPFKAKIKNLTYSSLGKDSSGRLRVYEGDTLAISFSGGSGEVSVTCADLTLISLQSGLHPKANSRLFRIPVVSAATNSALVITDSNTTSSASFPISILKPEVFGTKTEDIK